MHQKTLAKDFAGDFAKLQSLAPWQNNNHKIVFI